MMDMFQNYQSYETGMPLMNNSLPNHLSGLENDYHIPTSNQSYQAQLSSPSHQPPSHLTSPLHHMSPDQSRLQNYGYNQTQQQVMTTPQHAQHYTMQIISLHWG